MLLVFAVVGGVYLRTLSPGIYPVADTPKFQYLGRVLGTAHSPGYPLYILWTYVWSYLPIGSLAYRMNLFSAFWGAVAAALMFGVCRATGCGRLPAASAALSLAFGRIFWSQAVVAEVYMLASAQMAGLLLTLIRWDQTGRRLWLYLAGAVLAMSLAHHYTAVMALPGMVLFVCLSRQVRAFREWRVIATMAGLLLLGAAHYLFIVVRTRQGAPAVEAWANNLHELVGVLRVDSASSRLWAYRPAEILHQVLPMALREIRRELWLAGVALLLLGLWRVVRSSDWT
jgi:4-amino-4-deoxy-L-arabinose transferase-like glycosyltransferase